MKKCFNLATMLIDIGVNLTDGMYQGIYHGIKRHDPDIHSVLSRAWDAGVKHIIVTGGNLAESKEALELVKDNDKLSCTVGVHPTRCNDIQDSGDAEQYIADLQNLIKIGKDKVTAFGEFGLDYDRLHFCDKETQLKYLRRQLEVVADCKLPMFLHCRNSASDLRNILAEQAQPLRGVVHSFDGSIEEAMNFIELGLYIGLNGCSLKTKENLEVVKQLPLDRILLETDAPWCEVRPGHAGASYIKSKLPPANKKEKWNVNAMVKSRNEPCAIVQILDIVAGVRGESTEDVLKQVHDNTLTLFPNIK